ncbi:hypothetical protein AYX19_08740 [Paenarthrobacter ureafaciens]|nr:hypothetical protein AYX19_08740 [Paenarthrobacter ureafaciens]
MEGCGYAGTYRLGRGETDTYVGWMHDEHPEHPATSGVPRNVKPKELHLEIELDRDGELNF